MLSEIEDSFDLDEEYFWYVSPLFEKLSEETGEMIGLYDDAAFGGESLIKLGETVDEAMRLVEDQPTEWQVLIGHGVEVNDQGEHIPKEIYSEVSRGRFISLLKSFKDVITRAKQRGEYVVFIGD